jgi:N-acetyl-anhydromuramyl-L-alanine amidase AmpD
MGTGTGRKESHTKMNIIEMLVPDAYVFPGSWGYVRKWLILHKTAGFQTAQEVAQYFQSGSNGLEVSVHYVIGQDGAIVQCVRESDGAGGNGVLEAGHDPWWTMDNPNLVTFSIEHVDPATDNSTPLTPAQKASSFWLIRDLCTRQHILMQPASAAGGITGHYSIDPLSRKDCPGNYPWAELWNDLKGAQSMPIPTGWHDTGTELIAPNKHFFIHGFRDHVLNAANWDPNDVPLEEEQQVNQTQLQIANAGPGTRQLTMSHLLAWSEAHGVHEVAAGKEIATCYNLIASLRKQIADLQVIATVSQTVLLQSQLDATHTQIIDLQHKITTATEALK